MPNNMLTPSVSKIKSNFFKAKLFRPFITPDSQTDEANSDEKGMSIIEIIIVISLIGVVMTLVATQFLGQREEVMRDAARLSMSKLEQSLELYRVHNGRFPTTDQGLRALVDDPGNARKWRGPYGESKSLVDPWGSDLAYESDGRTFKIISIGPDEVQGSEDDLSYPEQSAAE